MSIRVQIRELLKARELIAFDPPDARPAKRRLFLTQEAVQQFTDSGSAVGLLGCKADIRAAMVRWVRGERVYKDFLKRLDPIPPKTFEVRVTQPIVQVRLFGRFAYEDTFIITKFYTRGLLGKRSRRANKHDQWDDAKRECEETWNRLFPNHAPFTAFKIRYYVTENCDEYEL